MPNKPRSDLLALALASGLLLSSGRASADIPPPVGWKETCTLELTRKAGEECFSCSAFYDNPAHCKYLLSGYQFESRCKTRGASVWSEIWCRAGSPSAKAVPQNVVSALASPTDNAGLDAKPIADAGGTDASTAPTGTSPTSTAVPTNGATNGTVTSTDPPVPSATATDAPPRPHPAEDTPKKGACGACAIGSTDGGATSSTGTLSLGALAFALCLGLSRRVRRARRSPA